jgi:hypothetical protein
VGAFYEQAWSVEKTAQPIGFLGQRLDFLQDLPPPKQCPDHLVCFIVSCPQTIADHGK